MPPGKELSKPMVPWKEPVTTAGTGLTILPKVTSTVSIKASLGIAPEIVMVLPEGVHVAPVAVTPETRTDIQVGEVMV